MKIKWMNRRIIVIAVGTIVVLSIVGRVVAGSGGGGDVAVDTTGASAGDGGAKQAKAAGKPSPTPAAGAAQAAPTPAAAAPTPTAVEVPDGAVNVERKPLILLNPSTIRQGSSLGVTGSGFDPGAAVDLFLKQQASDTVDPVTFVQVDKSGGFGGVNLTVPNTLPAGSFIVEARQRNSDKAARATGLAGGGSPTVKLGTQVGKPGDVIELAAQGFGADEDVKVFWNGLGGSPVATLHSDGGGAIRQGAVRVPFGAVGNNAFVFVGDTSRSPVTISFLMLNLFPAVELSSYAIKPDNVLSFAGKDFGPDERVLVYLNSPDGRPLATVTSDAAGAFANGGGFLVPFGLRGQQTLIFIGEQSRAPTTASFDILPYTPNAQPSTYGGRPGTAVTFYGLGFARTEVVHVFVGRTRDNPGRLVSCFRTDDQGNAGAAGSFVIPGDIQAGQLLFTLVGNKSQAAATAAVEVMPSDVPVQIPAQPEFKCPFDQTQDASSGQTATTAAPGAAQARGNP